MCVCVSVWFLVADVTLTQAALELTQAGLSWS